MSTLCCVFVLCFVFGGGQCTHTHTLTLTKVYECVCVCHVVQQFSTARPQQQKLLLTRSLGREGWTGGVNERMKLQVLYSVAHTHTHTTHKVWIVLCCAEPIEAAIVWVGGRVGDGLSMDEILPMTHTYAHIIPYVGSFSSIPFQQWNDHHHHLWQIRGTVPSLPGTTLLFIVMWCAHGATDFSLFM